MRNLSRFLENPFDDPNISMDELMAFSTDNLERMIAANTAGEWDDDISATLTALENLATADGNNQAKLGVRRARKNAKNAFRRSLPEQVRRVASTLEGITGVNSAAMDEAFPEGRTVFGDSADDRLAIHLGRMNDVVIANTAQLPAAIVTLSASLVSNWTSLHSESESASGEKALSEEARRVARAALQLQLYRNLIHLMDLFPRQPEKLAIYMQQHLLEDHPSQEEEEPTPEPEPTP